MAVTGQRPWMVEGGTPERLRGAIRPVLVVAGIAVLASQVQTGPPRAETVNPHPAGTYTYAGVARGTQPWLGVEHWPEIMQAGSLVALLVFFTFAVRASRGQRVWNPLLVLGVAFVISTWMDPSANWVSYAAYNPELLHYRSGWWSDASPTVEPLLMAMSFPVVLSIPGVVAVALHRRRLACNSGTGWAAKHPLIWLLAVSWAIGWGMDIFFFNDTATTEIYTYTQAPEWGVLFGGTTYQFPVLGALLVSGMMAVSGPLLRRDDRGATLANRIGERIPVLRRHPNGAAVVAACLVIALSMVPFYAVFGTIRLTHQARELARPWVYQELKVYDPHGDYRLAGEPGPYFGESPTSVGGGR